MEVGAFGVQGLEIVRGGVTYNLCVNTYGHPHTLCKVGEEERLYRDMVVKSGEQGRREDLGAARLGFSFKEPISVMMDPKIKEVDEPYLRRLAFLGYKPLVHLTSRKEQVEGEEAAAWQRYEKEQERWVEEVSSRLANRKVEPEETVKVTVKAGFKARGRPEDRNQWQVDKEKELAEEKQKEKEMEMEKEKERETGWKKVAGGGLKGGSPTPSSSTVPLVSNLRHF